jgi:hypothetical protein
MPFVPVDLAGKAGSEPAASCSQSNAVQGRQAALHGPYLDIRGQDRPAGTFATKKQASGAWKQAEADHCSD